MDVKRMARHLAMTPARVRRTFPVATLHAIERAIGTAECSHAGQLRFAVEGALDCAPLLHGQPARERAIDLFAQLRIWDTEHNNGVLIYLLLADRVVEIIADRGIAKHIAAHEWQRICRRMESAFSRGQYEQGAQDGIKDVAQMLARHFPPQEQGGNELPDQPLLL